MMRKIAALLLAVVMTASIAGCGGNASDNSKTGEDNANVSGSEGEEAAELDVENVYDLYVTWPSLSGAPADLAMVEDAVNDIVTEKLGVNVILNAISLADLTSQQQLLISSGEAIDVVCCLWTGLDAWVNTESLLELDDYMNTYAADLVEQYGDIAYGCSYNGHVYGFPGADSGYAYGFWANSDILAKYGYATEDRTITIEELEEMFATIKEGEGDGYYMIAGGGAFGCLDGRYDNLGGSDYTGAIMLDGDTEKVVNVYETQAYADYAYRMYDWAQKGYISADAATTEDSPQTLLTTGSYFGAFSQLGEGTRSSYGSNGTVPLTALEIQPGYTIGTDLTDIIFGVASTCAEPEKAVAFLNELYTNPDLSNLLMYGVEGVHYEVVEESEEGYRQIAFPEGVDMNNSGYYVFLGVWAVQLDTVWQSPAGYAEIEERNARREYEISPAFGYTFNSSEYSTEITALSAVYNEYYKIIDCGAINPEEELTAFIDALKAANIDTVIAANQEQYDAWKAAQ